MNRHFHFEKFIDSHTIFTTEESVAFLAQHHAEDSYSAVLKEYEHEGRIVHIHKNIYGTVPHEEIDPDYPYYIDPECILNKLAPDVVVAHYAACYYMGLSYPIFNHYMTYYSEYPIEPFTFQNTDYERLPYPSNIMKHNAQFFNTKRAPNEARITQHERTLVDTLSHPEYSGGWEFVWRAFEYRKVDLNIVLEYLRILDDPASYAIVGLFLEHHREHLNIPAEFLQDLEQHRPAKPHRVYHYPQYNIWTPEIWITVKRWNLIVPQDILIQSWDEFCDESKLLKYVG